MFSMLSWLTIGGLLGWLTSAIMRPSARSAMVQNIIIGSVSALLSGFLGRVIGFYGPAAEAATFVFVLPGTIIILVIVNLSRRREVRSPEGRPPRISSPSRRDQPPPIVVTAQPRVFLSYRRDDTGGYAVGLSDRLRSRFGQDDHVFIDVDTIAPGQDFVEVIKQAVGSCDVFLALIGPEWLQSTDTQGHRRLDNPEDAVRLEITTALDRNIPVIPVLVGGTRMPSADQLPDPLKTFARRNALEISNTRWQYDVDRLIESIERSARRSPSSL